MEETATLKDNVKDYVETKIDILKLKAVSKGAPMLANVIVGVAVAFLGIFILMFLSFSAAYAISDATDRPFLGFLVVAGFYILLTVLVIVLKNKLLTTAIMHALLKSLYTRNEDEQQIKN